MKSKVSFLSSEVEKRNIPEEVTATKYRNKNL